jgi:hypothetical protein
MQSCQLDAHIPDSRRLEIALPEDFPVRNYLLRLIIEDNISPHFSANIRKAQAIVRRHVLENVSLIDELLRERKKENCWA